MIETPVRILSSNKDDVLPVLQAFFSCYPQAACSGAEELADQLRAGGWRPRYVSVHEVEAVLEALIIEGEVVA